jgi:bifunctional DNA-binding transcriptional regulator/antitoxin component of YhaV-PrlF toxin-antitoxin module
VILPKEIKQALNITPKDYVSFNVVGPNSVLMQKVEVNTTFAQPWQQQSNSSQPE